MNTNSNQMLSQRVRELVDLCLNHAAGLLDGARRLLAEPSLPHLSFHLSILALEEVGKAGLYIMEALAAAHQKDAGWLHKALENHEKKIFHALWGSTFGRQELSAQQIEQHRALAAYLHAQRKLGLYVDVVDDVPSDPTVQVSNTDAKNAVGLATSLLEMARLKEYEPLSAELADTYEWFFGAVDDPENFKLVFGKKSMEKLRELGNGKAWMEWLRQQFEQAEMEARALSEKELAKPRVEGDAALEPKWRMTLRFRTQSHTVRARELNDWNRRVDWIRLVYVQKPDELLLQVQLPKGVSAQALYGVGLDTANRLLAAFNIGTRGFFWWYFPEHLSKYYESLRDLESNRDLTVERSPSLRMDWDGRVLDRQNLNRVLLCFLMLPRGDRAREGHKPFLEYLNGVAVMAKGDVHYHAEGSAYHHFFKALKQAMMFYGDWDGQTPFSDAFERTLSHLFMKAADMKYLSFGERLENGEHPREIDLQAAAVIKLFCDAYLFRALRAQGDRFGANEADVDRPGTEP